MFGSMTVGAAATALSFLSALNGTWTCTTPVPAHNGTPASSFSSTWRVAAGPGKSNWATVTYGKGTTTWGTAYVGYVEQQHRWVYMDFHNDGAIAEMHAPPAADPTWVWTGSYYPEGGPADPSGQITWTLAGPNKIDRNFQKRQNGTLVELSRDVCTRAHS